MPAFDTLNYSLRTNKNIERKIIFDGLKLLDTEFQLHEYRYLGFGSIWFVDFAIAHKILGIEDMISIERDEIGFARASFNQPLKCITVERGESSKVIPNLRLEKQPIVAWLDYEGNLFSSPALPDVQQLCEVVSSGSILMVTVNAHIGQLDDYMDSDDKLESIRRVLEDMGKTETERLQAINQIIDGTDLTIQDKRLRAFRKAADNLAPHDLKRQDLRRRVFPQTLAKAIINKFRHSIVVSGREVEFIPIFNFFYQDNAPMITVGGMVADERDESKLEKLDLSSEDLLTGEDQLQVNVPPLTVKEKLALDRCLPRERRLTRRFLKRACNFVLRQEQIDAYQQFYKQYPVYREVDL